MWLSSEVGGEKDPCPFIQLPGLRLVLPSLP